MEGLTEDNVEDNIGLLLLLCCCTVVVPPPGLVTSKKGSAQASNSSTNPVFRLHAEKAGFLNALSGCITLISSRKVQLDFRQTKVCLFILKFQIQLD